MTEENRNILQKLLEQHRELGISEQLDYDKFYLYSIITHSTALEGSTLTELENQLLFDEITAFKTSMAGEMSEKNVRKELSERQRHILSLIAADSRITTEQMSEKTGVNEKTIRRDLAILQQQGIIERVGGRKLGQWMIKEGQV